MSFGRHFAIEVLFSANILGEPILDFGKLNLAIKYFL